MAIDIKSSFLFRYVHAKLSDVNGLDPLDISEYGPEFHEIKRAVYSHMEAKKDPGRLETKALRDGMQFLM